MIYRLYVPTQAVGANLVYFDMFHTAGAGLRVELMSAQIVISGSTAVVGTVGLDLFLTRTTAIGTGGTANTTEGSSLSACTITCHDGASPVNPLISARLTPGGGATGGAVIAERCVFTEETSAPPYQSPVDFVRNQSDVSPIMVPEGTGIRVVQGSVASVGNIGFDLLLRINQSK